MQKEQENFKNWFKQSKVTDVDGNPLMVYHGTLNDFSAFDIDKTRASGFWGKGFYFTTSVKDANNNYANKEGADFKSNLSTLIDNIYDRPEDFISESKISYFSELEIDDDFSLTEEQSLLLAFEHMGVEHEGVVVPAYLSLQNPFTPDIQFDVSMQPDLEEDLQEVCTYLESDKFKKLFSRHNISINSHELDNFSYYFKEYCFYSATEGDVIDWENFQEYLINDHCFEDETSQFIAEKLDKKFGENIFCEFKENNGIVNRLISFIQNKISDSGAEWNDVDKVKTVISEHVFNKYTEGHDSTEPILTNGQKFLKGIEENSYDFYEEYGDLSIQEILRNFLISEGYDGIIMNAEFKGMGIPEGTQHIICFEPTQIKSAIGNNGQFSPENADILYRAAKKINNKHEIMPLVEVKEHIMSFNINMEHFGKFKVFDTVEEAQLKGALPVTSSRNTKGFYHAPKNNQGQGYIGIIRSNIESKEDLIATYAHEAIGHYSVKELLGESYKPTMLKLFSHYNQKYKPEFNPNHDNFFTTNQKIHKAEEFLATSIEKKALSGFSGIRILVGAILNKVRKFVPDLPITSFDTDYLEKAAFDFYKKNTLKDIEIAKVVEEANNESRLKINRISKNKNLKNVTPSTI